MFVTDIEKIFGSKASSAIESIKKTTETTFSVERTVVGRFAGISEKASIEITSNYTIKGMINGEKMMTVTGTLIKTTGLPPAAVKGSSPTSYVIKGNLGFYKEGNKMYAFPIKNMKLKILKLLFFPCLGIVLFIFLDKFNILNLLYTKTQIIYEMNELFRGEKMFNYDDMIGMSISFTGMIFLLFFTFFLFFIKDLYLLIGLYISILFSICLIFYGLW